MIDPRFRHHTLLDKNGQTIRPESVELTTFYAREGKAPKILHRLAPDPANPDASQLHALLRYNQLYALDTNTPQIRDQRISVTALAAISLQMAEAGRLRVRFEHPVMFEFRGIYPEINPECVGWMYVAAPSARRDGRVGMLVDSELGRLQDMNAGRAAVYGRTFLPRNVELLYASAEVGIENIPNQIMKSCDDAATELLDRLEWDLDEDNLHHDVGAPYLRRRTWIRPGPIVRY